MSNMDSASQTGKGPAPRHRPPPALFAAWAGWNGTWRQLTPFGADVGFCSWLLSFATAAGQIPRNAQWAVLPRGLHPMSRRARQAIEDPDPEAMMQLWYEAARPSVTT
jgi:hypothetical protein